MIPQPLLLCATRHPAASEVEVSAAEQALGIGLPPDYREFLLVANGVEGFVAPQAYVMFWPVSDLVSLNSAYSVDEFLGRVTLIGTDGAETGYGFRLNKNGVEYISTPLIGMSPETLRTMGTSLDQLLTGIADTAA